MSRPVGASLDYCPHAPGKKGHVIDAALYSIVARLSFQIIDFQSALDGVVACAVLFSLLFFASLVNPPAAGLLEVYRNSLLMAGLMTACALAVIFMYARFVAKNVFHFRLGKAKESMVTSASVLAIWATVWVLFGVLSRTYSLVLEPTRLALVPLALIVGLLDGFVVFAFCAERFALGLGKEAGILISSFLGWLLFLAVSVDFALYVLPIVVTMTYVGVRTGSPLGPTLVMGFLMVFFHIFFAASPWILGSRQVGYWFMTVVSVAAAFVAGLVLTRIPLGGPSHAENPAI